MVLLYMMMSSDSNITWSFIHLTLQWSRRNSYIIWTAQAHQYPKQLGVYTVSSFIQMIANGRRYKYLISFFIIIPFSGYLISMHDLKYLCTDFDDFITKRIVLWQ
eukprot:1095610_1